MTVPVVDIPALQTQILKNTEQAQTWLLSDSAEEKAKGLKLFETVREQKAQIVSLQELENTRNEMSTALALGGSAAHKDSGEPTDLKSGQTVLDHSHKPQGSDFKNFARFVRGVYLADARNIIDNRLYWHEDDPVSGKNQRMSPVGAPQDQKVMIEGVGASGGFLVPPEQQQTLLSVDAPEAIVRPRATIVRMNRRQINIPVVDQTVGATGIAPWFGGLQVYWTEETGLKTASDMAFREITLVANKMTLRSLVSNELIDDSMVSIADLLSGPRGFGGAIPWTEEYAFIRGTGAGQPRGIIGAPVTIVVTRAAQAGVTIPDVVNMYASHMVSANSIWMASQSLMPSLLQLNGPAGNASYVFMPSMSSAMPNYLLGIPLIFSDKLPVTGQNAVGDLILADWSYYLIGDRQATTLASSVHEYFSYNKVVFRAEHRIDGQPWMSAPITYEDGTTQVSPFVVLGAKST